MKKTEYLVTENKKGRDDKITLSSHLNYIQLKVFSPSMRVFRIGINFNLLFNLKISIQHLNTLISTDLKNIQKNNPTLSLINSLKPRINWSQGTLLVWHCNFFTPENDWFESLQQAETVILWKYVKRFGFLLSFRKLSFWQATAFVEAFLSVVSKKYHPLLAHELACHLLDSTLVSYVSFLNPSNNFYSFVFNDFQKYFSQYGYNISISKALVTANFSVDFLINFFTHNHNQVARRDLWDWGHEDSGVAFNDNFNQFWLDNSYSVGEIEFFKKKVLPDLGLQKPSDFKQSTNTQIFLPTPTREASSQMLPIPVNFPLQTKPWVYNS